jgi:hypothetical protein
VIAVGLVDETMSTWLTSLLGASHVKNWFETDGL